MVKVLIVDDSPTARLAITKMLKDDKEIRIVGTASNGREAIEKVKRLKPDIVTLDIEMPVMNGLDALPEIKKACSDCKVIVVSTLTAAGTEATLKACELGADEYITKPKDVFEMMAIKDIVKKRIKALVHSKEEKKSASKLQNKIKTSQPRETQNIEPDHDIRIIGINSSTGGPKVLMSIIPALPKNFPVPIVIAQHMAKNFTKTFAEHLDKKSKVIVKEAEQGERIRDGVVYVSKGGTNMVVTEDKTIHYVNVKTRFRPSGDLLFESIANTYGDMSAGIVLTGMGNDGSQGIVKIKEAGGITIAEDLESATVPTMPKKAIETGKVDYILSPEEIKEFLMSLVKVRQARF